ncbi:MAG: hypothetical protein HY551_01100 [Elusimicrobia bacterium]|nr:hypothetical protein [Elusimicrobiota bacterium]
MRKFALSLLPLLAAPAWSVPSWTQKPFGILLLAHGGSSEWNKAVLKIRDALASRQPAEAAFGMADSVEIQRALDKLEARKVSKIIAVPLFISSDSEVMDQTRYVLGIRKEPSRDFMSAPHSHRHSVTLKRIRAKLPIVMTNAIDDHPIVARILLDRAKEMSRAPGKEAVVLIGHGPLRDDMDARWLKTMQALGDFVQREGGFASVHAATLRDDAPAPVREKADRELRALVGRLSRQGKVLVVPHLISRGGIERHIQRSLEGLFYEWTGKTLLPDDRIVAWARETAEKSAGVENMRLHKDGGRALPPTRRPLGGSGGISHGN